MGFLGNLIWLIFGGFFSAISWFFIGILWCFTIIGLPIGMQCFKMAKISLAPFGKKIELDGKSGSLILNVFWLIFGGVELAAAHAVWGLILCLTIVGCPFGKQFFKLAKLSLMPFGARVISTREMYLAIQ